jgi:hypothetical protein
MLMKLLSTVVVWMKPQEITVEELVAARVGLLANSRLFFLLQKLFKCQRCGIGLKGASSVEFGIENTYRNLIIEKSVSQIPLQLLFQVLACRRKRIVRYSLSNAPCLSPPVSLLQSLQTDSQASTSVPESIECTTRISAFFLCRPWY